MEKDTPIPVPPPTPTIATGQILPAEEDWKSLSNTVAQPSEYLGQHIQSSLTELLENKGKLTFDAVAVAFFNAHLSAREKVYEDVARSRDEERNRNQDLQERLISADRAAAVAQAALGAAQTANDLKVICSGAGFGIIALVPWLIEKINLAAGIVAITIALALIAVAFKPKVSIRR